MSERYPYRCPPLPACPNCNCPDCNCPICKTTVMHDAEVHCANYMQNKNEMSLCKSCCVY